MRRASPFNQGICALNSPTLKKISDYDSPCLSDLTDCSEGFVVSFWLFVEQAGPVDRNTDLGILKIGNIQLFVHFGDETKSFVVGYIVWRKSEAICAFHLNLPLKAWFNILIILKPDLPMEVILNGLHQTNLNGNCQLGTDPVVSEPAIRIGHPNLDICFDEYKFAKIGRLGNFNSMKMAYHYQKTGLYIHHFSNFERLDKCIIY